MMRKRIRIQKKRTARPDEPQTDVKISVKVRSETKKKLESSAELIKKIETLLQEAAAKIQEAERLIQPFRYVPRVSNCEGWMIDLSRR